VHDVARALIVGAGGIGRGFTPWALRNFEIDLYDANADLTSSIRERGGYTSHMSDGESLAHLHIAPRIATSDIADLDVADYDIAFVAVGPRNVGALPAAIGELRCPVFSLENDPATVDVLRAAYGLTNAFFGVPDVITSSTASPESLAEDANALHTEDGVLYLQDSPLVSEHLRTLLPDVEWLPVEQLNAEWDAKLYIHNTPHCIAAFLGFLSGTTYLHEALAQPAIARIVDGVVEEILYGLKIVTDHDHQFLERYAEKEIKRFSNRYLYDPVSRVAREPLRKLQPAGRLVGALRLLLFSGVQPTYLMAGIAAGLRYAAPGDADFAVMRLLDEFGVEAFLKFHLGLPPRSVESQYIATHFEPASAFLDRNVA
jgi:hypothetical protein